MGRRRPTTAAATAAGAATALLATALLAGGCGILDRGGAEFPTDPAIYVISCENDLGDIVHGGKETSARLNWLDPATGAKGGSAKVPDVVGFCAGKESTTYRVRLRFSADLTRVTYRDKHGAVGWVDLTSGRRHEVAAAEREDIEVQHPTFVPGTETFAYVEWDESKRRGVPVQVAADSTRRGPAIECASGFLIPTKAAAMARCAPSAGTIANPDGSILVTDRGDGRGTSARDSDPALGHDITFPDSGAAIENLRLPTVDYRFWRDLPCTARLFVDHTRMLCANEAGQRLGLVSIDPGTKAVSAVMVAEISPAIGSATVSPDGKTAVFDSSRDSWNLYTVPITGGEPVKVPSTSALGRRTLVAWQ